FNAPAHHVFTLLVHQDHRAMATVGDAVDDVLVPVPQLVIGGIAALERDVGVSLQSDELAHGARNISALAIVHGVAVSSQAAAFAEAAHGQAIDFQTEIKCTKRVYSCSCRHLSSSCLTAGVGCEEADADDHKLRWLHRRHADDDNQFAVVDIGLGHGGAVALDEEGLFRLGAFQTTVAPHRSQEIANGAANAGPQRLSVGFKHYPLQAAIDGFFNEDEQPA